ncbi:hypothetical protein RCG23_12815 [Neobacillus sp. PS3-34]|uniref:GNAT family N-acetyltransferase n=1 Tax=Neobacillus sp. PS3-34 TaxID=3070678 RepID=UPI0027E0920D|nr:hypothetical protein [Neobacillus sp. PS3-34]WML46553.1 hypothetical protein RCG23_12815 [Neobacillus sp. PS3-34]
MQALIRSGEERDFARVIDFLTKAGLGTEGLSEEVLPYFLLMENSSGEIKGLLGIEALGEDGLLRSLAITPDLGERDIILLFEQMMVLAKNKKLSRVFLATNKIQALDFFHVLGFKETEIDDLPEKFFESKHIQHIFNVDNSIFLKFSL